MIFGMWVYDHKVVCRSKVKVQQRSLWYATHHLMDMHPHTKYYWPISKETIIWPRGQRTRSHEGHYGTWHTTLWSGEWYLVCGCMTTRSVLCTIMTFVWTLTSRSNNCFFRDRSMIFGMWVHENKAVWPNIIHLSRKTKNVMAGTRKYYLKNHYLTFRSKVKVPGRSLWYTTHRLAWPLEVCCVP
jgi:hypothetical protein